MKTSTALLLGFVFSLAVAVTRPVLADAYEVTYNPYAGVAWDTVLRCQSQHHDHITHLAHVRAYDDAGYCAVMYLNYSGLYRKSTQEEWEGLGSPATDPGQPVGWVEYRRWPPEDFGAPDPSTLTNIEFYIPGAEEVGLLPDGSWADHITSPFLETYLEGLGCDACGVGGIPVATDNSGLPADQRYASDQELIDRTISHGGDATFNHPLHPLNTAIATLTSLQDYGSIEMFNNLCTLREEAEATNPLCLGSELFAAWDAILETRPRTWGVSDNDHFGAFMSPIPAVPNKHPEITAKNLDRGKLQVLVTSYDLPSYRTAFEAGSFFAVVEDNAVKNSYPDVTGISVTAGFISLSTAAGSEAVTWIGNGEVVGTGASLSLSGLPPDLGYVRAEIDDGDGRTVYVQPFSLGPAPAPIPVLGPAGVAITCLSLVLCLAWMRRARRTEGLSL